MKVFFSVLIAIFFIRCSTQNKTGETFRDTEPSADANPPGDNLYIGPAHYFASTQEFYTPVYSKNKNDGYSFDELVKKADSTVYDDEEIKRKRMPFTLAARIFNVSGLARISVFNERHKLISTAQLTRIEYFEDFIEGYFIAVFKPEKPVNDPEKPAYCISGSNFTMINDFKTETVADTLLDKLIFEKLHIKPDRQWIVKHVRILPENTLYSILSFDDKSFLTEFKRNELIILKEIKNELCFVDLLPVPIARNNKPVLLTILSIPETDMVLNTLAVFNETEYVFAEDSRVVE